MKALNKVRSGQTIKIICFNPIFLCFPELQFQVVSLKMENAFLPVVYSSVVVVVVIVEDITLSSDAVASVERETAKGRSELLAEDVDGGVGDARLAEVEVLELSADVLERVVQVGHAHLDAERLELESVREHVADDARIVVEVLVVLFHNEQRGQVAEQYGLFAARW